MRLTERGDAPVEPDKSSRISGYNAENNYQYFPRQFLTGDGVHARCFWEDHSDTSEGGVLLPHMHGFFEIELITEGCGGHAINAMRYPLRPGMIHLIRPGDVHQYLFHGETIRMYTVQFDQTMLLPALISEMSLIPSPLYCDTGEDAPILAGMLRMAHESEATDPAYSLGLLHCQIEILTRYILARAPHPVLPTSAALRTALSYISVHYYKKLTLEQLAAVCLVSSEHLGRLFKAELGCSAPEYLNHYRLRIASNLIRSTGYTLRQIGAESGYQSYRHFSRAFTEYYGASPSAYREAITK